MLSDAHNAFTWNARNQVATLNGSSLQYDAAGRRIRNAAGKSFLYDGVNSTQELSGTTPIANLWTGGIDELFQRTDSNGSVVPLADALGSTIALVNSSGNLVTTYSYDPFGNTTTAGAVSSNPSQYTGRENEGNGLYFNRARCYSPVLGRFISEDPLGFAGGDPNYYAYVGNDPINNFDPSGLRFKGPACLIDPNAFYCRDEFDPPKLSGRKQLAEFVGQLLGLLGAECIDPNNCTTFGLGPRSRPHNASCEPDPRLPGRLPCSVASKPSAGLLSGRRDASGW